MGEKAQDKRPTQIEDAAEMEADRELAGRLAQANVPSHVQDGEIRMATDAERRRSEQGLPING